jgi:hypothetical protein
MLFGTLQLIIKALFREKITYRTEVWETPKQGEKEYQIGHTKDRTI